MNSVHEDRPVLFTLFGRDGELLFSQRILGVLAVEMAAMVMTSHCTGASSICGASGCAREGRGSEGTERNTMPAETEFVL